MLCVATSMYTAQVELNYNFTVTPRILEVY